MGATRGWLGRFVMAALLAIGAVQAPAWGEDARGTSREDRLSLQRRLTDAGCYKGAIDGAASAALDNAVKACPDQRPVLRIETGMHTLVVSGIDADAACDLAVTGSPDKTARIWSLPDGRLQRTIRPPIGEKQGGAVDAVAMSPDGRMAAISVQDALGEARGTYAVYVFDPRVGDALRRIGSFGGGVFNLAFSPDGRQLAIGQYSGGSSERDKLHLFDVASGRQLGSDPDSTLGVTSLAFGPDGDLYAMRDDGALRHYDHAMKRLATTKIADRDVLRSVVAVDPTGRRIAIGFGNSNSPAIYIVDARSLSLVGMADTTGMADTSGNLGPFSKLAWTRDGRLIAGGNARSERHIILGTFDFNGRRLGAVQGVSRDTIESMRSCGNGVVFASWDPSFGVVGGDGHVWAYEQDHVPDMYGKDESLMVSDDGKQVRFGLGGGETRPIRFDLATGSVSDSGTDAPGLHPPDTTGLPLKGIHGADPPTLNGKTLIPEYEVLEYFAVRPDRAGLVIITSWDGLHSFDADAKLRWSRVGHGNLAGANFGQRGDLVIVAYHDGTIRWHRWSDGAELLSLFVDAKTKRFVAWTPTGYYMASAGGEDLIGWHVNRGWNQPADFFPASRFRDRFNRPDIVELVLDTLDEDAAVKQADAKAHRRAETKRLVAQLPPLIRITDPPDGGRFATAEAKIDYVWRSPSALPVDAIEVSIDGRPMKEETLPVRPADANAEIQGSLEVALPPHDVEVGLTAYSGDLKSETVAVKLTWTGPVPPTAPPRHLHALIAGVSDYASPDMALAYAAKDARDFAHALESQRGGYYTEVETRVIVDRDVTRASLIDGLDWLAKQAGPDDVSVLFLAGHGLTDENLTYWYLPSDATEEQAHGKGVSQDDVRRALRSAPGKVVWFLDTCHAGGAAARSAVDVNRLMNTVTSAENGGIVAFASSQGNETSFESSVWKNGAFTKALVDGIEHGEAAVFGQDAIKTSVLEAYLEARVGELTEHAQTPTMQLPPQVTDFIIARVKNKR
jgi:WD40 repeat protein